ncbi:MAG: hypothetical protein QXI58_01860 [Candidatus Micrarchaeia archaeon]
MKSYYRIIKRYFDKGKWKSKEVAKGLSFREAQQFVKKQLEKERLEKIKEGKDYVLSSYFIFEQKRSEK